MNERQELDELIQQFPAARDSFEECVRHAAAHVTTIARPVAQAIGEISIDEAKTAIVREFTKALDANG